MRKEKLCLSQISLKNGNRTQLTIQLPNYRSYSLNQKSVSSSITTAKSAKKQYKIQGNIVRTKNKNNYVKFYAEITKQNIFPPYTPKNNTSSVTEQQQNIYHNQKQNINKIMNPTMVRINNNSPIIHNNKSSPSKNNIQNICKNPINNTNLRNYTNLLRTENANLKDDKKRTDPNLISKINSLIKFPEIKINLPITETKYI